MLGNSDVDPRPERRGRCRWRLFPMPCACGGLPAAAERMSSAAPANGRETCRKRHVKRCRVRLRYMPCAVSRWAGTNPQIHARSRGRVAVLAQTGLERSDEHTSELQSLMRLAYAVFCLKKKNKPTTH